MKKITMGALLTLGTLLQGCAFTDAKLDVKVPLDAKLRGPLSSVDSTNFQIGEIIDSRIDKDRIGWKKNGFGQNTADILPERPVAEILQDGLTKTLADNGHVVGNSGLTITGELKNFWFEFDANFWTIEFIGNLEALFVLLNTSGEEIYSNTYSGAYSEKKAAGSKKTWSEVMSKALESLLEDFAFDEELVEALENQSDISVD